MKPIPTPDQLRAALVRQRHRPNGPLVRLETLHTVTRAMLCDTLGRSVVERLMGDDKRTPIPVADVIAAAERHAAARPMSVLQHARRVNMDYWILRRMLVRRGVITIGNGAQPRPTVAAVNAAIKGDMAEKSALAEKRHDCRHCRGCGTPLSYVRTSGVCRKCYERTRPRKIPVEIVAEIYTSPEPYKCGAKHGVIPPTVSNILRRESWRKITESLVCGTLSVHSGCRRAVNPEAVR